MKFNVNHYIPTVVCVQDVEAETMTEAIEKSMSVAMRFAETFFTVERGAAHGIKHAQCAEGHLGALVDVSGDGDYSQSTFFGSEEARCFLPDGDSNGK